VSTLCHRKADELLNLQFAAIGKFGERPMEKPTHKDTHLFKGEKNNKNSWLFNKRRRVSKVLS